MKRVLSVNFF